MWQIRTLFGKTTFQVLVSTLTACLTVIALFWPYINSVIIHQSPISSLTSYVSGIFDKRLFISSENYLNIIRAVYSGSQSVGEGHQNDVDNNLVIKENRSRSILGLQRYDIDNIVDCLDSIFVRRNRSLYITFIGDSLMRNQFKNFLEFIPDYDRITSLNQTNSDTITRYHEDNNVTSKLLNDVLVSFRWNALINDKLISVLKYWAGLEYHQIPDIIFIGPTVHHMLKDLYNLNDRSFLDIVEQDLLPVLLTYLSNHPRKQIFWKIQSPTADILRSISSHPYNNLIHVKKINDYNTVVQRIFRGTGVAVWDSLLPVVEEYMRSCALQRFLRSDDTVRWWCGDYLHYGRLVSAIGSQQIFNHLCNNLEALSFPHNV